MGSNYSGGRPGYPHNMYIAYTKSVAVAMERRLLDLTPHNSETYWKWYIEEIKLGRERMNGLSRQIREIGAAQPRRLKARTVRVTEANKVDALISEELGEDVESLV